MSEPSSQSIALVVSGDAEPEEEKQAIESLRKSRMDDIRIIAAQACIRNQVVSGTWISRWLKDETNSEARGYLYLSLAIKNKSLAKKVLRQIGTNNLEDTETIFYNAGLAVAFRSRRFLLNIMLYIFSESKRTSQQASLMCRMLIEESDNETLRFLESLEREKWSR